MLIFYNEKKEMALVTDRYVGVINAKPVIKGWIIALQCCTFILLYAVWILPEIAVWRNISLGLGATLGLYVSYCYRSQLFTKSALPIWLIGLLFIWATFHLLFLSQNFTLQWGEYKSIWKRIFLSALFALGLGLSIINNPEKSKRWAWPLIYIALIMPTIIYLVKWTLTFYGEIILGQGPIPPFLKVYSSSQLFYVPKTDYVVFCLPTLAVALGQMLDSIQGKRIRWQAFFLYAISIVGISFVFYAQNIKNGFIYEVLLFSLFLLQLGKSSLKFLTFGRLVVISILILTIGLLVYKHVQGNESWRTLVADAKIAVQLDEYQHWKYNGEQGYPSNSSSKTVSATNYERIAWGIVGVKVLLENPLGYGLIENSFGPLVNLRWPESSPRLSHSHSGWLDLALGIGLPGIILVISALILALKQSVNYSPPWRNLGIWILLSSLFLWCTTEVSNNGNIDPLIFWIVMTTALGLSFQNIRDN
jgi:hypothetical protein